MLRLFMIVVSLAFITIGCSDSDQQQEAEQNAKMEQMSQDWQKAMESTKEFAGIMAEEFQKNFKENMDTWETQLEDFKSEAQQMGEELQENSQETIKQLQQEMTEMNKKFQEMAESNNVDWEKFQESFSNFQENMKNEIKELKNNINQDTSQN